MIKFNDGSFGYDLNFLAHKDNIILLKNEEGNAQVIVSPKYQGKVFTSTAAGMHGKSFGWINYSAFNTELSSHMNGYGGEDRLWIGPEGGKYSLFFRKDTEMEFENWHTPPAVDSESWNLYSATDKIVSMSKDMSLENYLGTLLKIRVNRDIEILENSAIEKALDIDLSRNVNAVGFRTINRLTNIGDQAWTRQTGAPCMWSVDMFTPSPKTVIIVPYEQNAAGNIASTDYFGQIPDDRIVFKDGVLFFKADGKSRGKLGLSPQRSTSMAGSFDAANGVLTITLFDVDKTGIYLNQEWTSEKNPLIGDAVNAYNDGPLADGRQMGPFYEIESVSPAAFLKPEENLTHKHAVFHFIGDRETIDLISKKTLGVSLGQIENAFNR